MGASLPFETRPMNRTRSTLTAPALIRAGLACALLAAAVPAQSFVDRLQSDDLRVVSYNVLWDTIFPSENATQAAKFERVVAALDADIWCLQEIDYSTSVNAVLNLMDGIAPIAGGWYAHKVDDCVIVSKFPLSMQATFTIPAGDKNQAMALVDLPDAQWDHDLYIMNNHYKCCGGFDHRRQEQSDSIVNWMRDAREPGGFFNLPAGTAMMVIGDLNIVDGPQPLQTLIDGNIIDEASFGADSPPDWDGTDSTDHQPLHNVVGPADWTWASPGPFPPGRLDYVITTDSVIEAAYSYALNTTTMSGADLAATGLQPNDVTVDSAGVDFDHIPLIVDFRPGDPSPWDVLGSALGGAHGEPVLTGAGTLVGGDDVTLTVSAALENAPTTLIVGFTALNVPLKGGTLVPAVDLLVSGLSTDGTGTMVLATPWPLGLPSGLELYLQAWIVDAAGPKGVAATNAVLGTTP